MAKIIDGQIFFDTSEAIDKINISRQMLINLTKKGWFDDKDVYIVSKKERNYYFFSKEAVEKLKKSYGEKK